MTVNKQAGAWALIYCASTNAFLMGKRSLAVKKPGLWNFFGGRVEPDEDPCTSVLRELLEETGFGLASEGFVRRVGEHNTELVPLGFVDGLRSLHYFLLLAEHEMVPTLNFEHDDFYWFAADKLPMHVNRATAVGINIGLVQKAIALTLPAGAPMDDIDTDYPVD